MKKSTCTANTHLVNRHLHRILLALMLTFSILSCLPQTARQTYAQEVVIHIVASGEYLSTIARRYNVSVQALMAYNNISNADLIRPGQQLRIPITTVQPPPTSTPVPAAPQEGGGSAAPVPTSAAAPENGEVATTTAIPTPRPTSTTRPSGGPGGYTAAGEPVYIVRRGDTLSGIAAQYGVTIAGIMQRNGLGSHGILVGQRLIIPIGAAVPTPTSTYPPPGLAPQAPAARPREQAAATATSKALVTPTRVPSSPFLITATPTPFVH